MENIRKEKQFYLTGVPGVTYTTKQQLVIIDKGLNNQDQTTELEGSNVCLTELTRQKTVL